MTDLVTLAKYPFLKASRQYIKENSISIEELLEDPLYERARIICLERLDNALNNRDVGNRSLATESDCIMELLSYPLARMITVCIGDNFFKRRYALAEAVHAYKNLINESTSFLIDVAKEFGFKIEYIEEENVLRIHFTNYLKNAPTQYKEWKMINRSLEKGFVRITHKDLARLIQEALRNRINEELDNRRCDERVYESFSEDILRIRNTLALHKKKIEAAPVGKLDIDKLPPCMKRILSSIQSGENVPHMGRFALVAFLNALKLDINDILRIFSTAPDFEEEKTRYQVEHITGQISSTSYKPPGCDKMKTYGICPIEEIDDICKKINHPVSYYATKWRRERKKK